MVAPPIAGTPKRCLRYDARVAAALPPIPPVRTQGPFLGRNIASTYIARGAALLAGFMLFPIVAGEVGLTMLGLWLFINSLTVFFALDFGMSATLVRYVADAHARGDRPLMSLYASSIFGFLTLVGLAGSIVFAAAMALLLPTLDVPPGETGTVVVMIAAVMVSSFVVSVPLSVFRVVIAGVQRYDITNLLTVFQAASRVAAVVGALRMGSGIVGVVLAEAVVAVAASIAGVVACRRVVPGVTISVRQMQFSTVRAMAPFAGRIFVIQVSALVILQTDNLVIGAVLSAASVTLYNSAFRIYQVCRELTNSFTAPLLPYASRSVVFPKADLRELLLAGTKYANALMVLVCVPLLFFSEEVLVAWAGDRFASAAVVLQILLAGLLINNNHLVAVSLLAGVGAVKQYARYHVAWAAANLCLSIVLAGPLGLVGVALGTTLPLIVLEPLYIRVATRTFVVPVRTFLTSAVGRVAAPAALAGAPLAIAFRPGAGGGLRDGLLWSGAWGTLFLAAFGRIGLTSSERAQIRHRVHLSCAQLRSRA